MSGNKTEHRAELHDDQVAWLKEMAERHGLENEHKALRCVLDHAMHDADADEIFGEIRCRHCG